MATQLNIHQLYESARKKELSKFETFDKILQRCHNKIKLYAENRKTECVYEIPGFIIGVPLFDVNELSPIKYVDKCYIPALFIAAEGDDFINKQHSQRLHDKYIGDKNLILVDGDHNARRPAFMYDR